MSEREKAIRCPTCFGNGCEDCRRTGRLGPTGRYPAGKLGPGDKGELASQISLVETPHGKRVLLEFGTLLSEIFMTADEAERLAAILVDLARQARS